MTPLSVGSSVKGRSGRLEYNYQPGTEATLTESEQEAVDLMCWLQTADGKSGLTSQITYYFD